jgi:hypothetical protein
MKTAKKRNGGSRWFTIALTRALVVAGFLFLANAGRAQFFPGGGGGGSSGPSYTPLESWYFEDTNSWPNAYGFDPISFTNLSSTWLGNGQAVVVDSTDPAWLQYNVYEADGTTNLTVDSGSVMFWFAPNWASTNDPYYPGSGSGVYGRLLEAGGYTPDSSYGWWSIYVDDVGANLYFSAQTNDTSSNCYTLSTPIDWTTNRFHFIALTYSSTNVSLYVDGALATNDPTGLTVWPSQDVLTNGFYLGSDSNGVLQAHGWFDDLRTYNVSVDSDTINRYFNNQKFPYWMNPANKGNDFNIPSGVTALVAFAPYTPVFSGPGNLIWVTNASSCVTSSNVWITDVVATPAAGGKMNLTFTIEGGYDGLAYDVFVNSTLSKGFPWSWQGQGYHCNRYTLTGMPSTTCFLELGTPQDTDGDGLTDAYEKLTGITDPNMYSTDGTGMADGWEIFYFGHTGVDPNADPDGDGMTNYQEYMAGTNPKVPDNFGVLVTEPKLNLNLP